MEAAECGRGRPGLCACPICCRLACCACASLGLPLRWCGVGGGADATRAQHERAEQLAGDGLLRPGALAYAIYALLSSGLLTLSGEMLLASQPSGYCFEMTLQLLDACSCAWMYLVLLLDTRHWYSPPPPPPSRCRAPRHLPCMRGGVAAERYRPDAPLN
jgi:hypothetical protein